MNRTEAIEVIRKSWPVSRNELLHEALKTLIPELKESEDERVRKFLIGYFSELVDENSEWGLTKETRDKIIAYLEKQKEQKPVEGTALQKAFISSKIDYTLEEKCDASDYAETILPTSVVYGENEEEYKLHKIIEAAFIAGQKKDKKPAEIHEPSNNELQRHQDELYDFKVFAAKQAREHHISFVHDFEWNNFCAELLSYFNKKQKPAEWSEEDEEKINNISEIIEHCITIPYSGGTLTLSKEYKKELQCFLKSLRHSWKPSEEQMDALKEAYESYDFCDGERSALESLYNDLKKL